MNGFVLDSTYLNACDPNSMRDQGLTRNAVYSAVITDNDEPANVSFKSGSRCLSQTPGKYQEFLRRDGATNNSFYSFGGRRNLKGVVKNTKPLVNPIFKKHWAGADDRRQVPRGEQVIYVKEPLERVQDYTKNISQSIFSPGLLPNEKVLKSFKQGRGTREAREYGNRQFTSPRKPQSAKPILRQKVITIASALKEERKRKEHL